MSSRTCSLVLAAVAAVALTAVPASADPVVGVDYSCVQPAGNPQPNTPEWIQRDTLNQNCAGLRIRDQLANPAFGFGNYMEGDTLAVDQATDQLSRPTEPNGGVTTLIPGSKGADPFRSVRRWTAAGLGRVQAVHFTSSDGAELRGHIFLPSEKKFPEPKDGYPGVVITDGSIQAYEELYYWAAEDLAAHGYMAMTYDVQGQGDSDLFGSDCQPADNIPPSGAPSGSCQGVPYQQNYNFYQGAEDSLSYFLSDKNPFYRDVDASRLGIAGHSLGAGAVSVVGQCDTRVKTIVAWDNLSAPANCSGVTVPAAYQADKDHLLHTPAMGMSNDYLFNTQPTLSPPDEHSKMAGYLALKKAGVDTEEIVFRGATHLTYTYIPLVFQASELNERMASYYTVAWFDQYLRGDDTGFDRLTAAAFDNSADTDSIGAGVFDPSKAVPGDPFTGNVPYTINGIKVPDSVSFYYQSGWALHDPKNGHEANCLDVRAGCPATEPATP